MKVALLGFGTVGRSVARLLCQAAYREFQLDYIFNRSVERKKVNWISPHVRWTERIEDVFSSDIDIVVELVGGLEPAARWIELALESGKSVVTAIKTVIAEKGPELLAVAHTKGVRLEFGAAVGGAIPILTALQEGLSGDRLYSIMGILNGTSNHVLSQMEAVGVTLEEAVRSRRRIWALLKRIPQTTWAVSTRGRSW